MTYKSRQIKECLYYKHREFLHLLAMLLFYNFCKAIKEYILLYSANVFAER